MKQQQQLLLYFFFFLLLHKPNLLSHTLLLCDYTPSSKIREASLTRLQCTCNNKHSRKVFQGLRWEISPVHFHRGSLTFPLTVNRDLYEISQ